MLVLGIIISIQTQEIGENRTLFKTAGEKQTEKGFFVVFRFYGPEEGYINKTWVLNDFELIK